MWQIRVCHPQELWSVQLDLYCGLGGMSTVFEHSWGQAGIHKPGIFIAPQDP